MIDFVYNLENIVRQLDNSIMNCSMYELDDSQLSDVRNGIVNFIELTKNSLPYKLARFEVYGEPLDEEDLEDIDPELKIEIEKEIKLIGY